MVISGHDFDELKQAFDWAQQQEGFPKVIVCKNVLGKDVSFMENVPGWHGVPPKKDERDKAIAELQAIGENFL